MMKAQGEMEPSLLQSDVEVDWELTKHMDMQEQGKIKWISDLMNVTLICWCGEGQNESLTDVMISTITWLSVKK